jgi:hypothetical protein
VTRRVIVWRVENRPFEELVFHFPLTSDVPNAAES